MLVRPPRLTLTYTLVPYTTLFLSQLVCDSEAAGQRTERREAVVARCEAVVPEVGKGRRIEERLALRIPAHAGRDAPVLAEGLLPARLDGMRLDLPVVPVVADRKSTRLNSSH